MADKLSIYKGALRLLGPHELSSLTDNRPERYQLDDAWDNCLQYLLTLGLWNFAVRSVTLTSGDDVAPTFGFDYGFNKPSDWIRTVGISDEPTFQRSLEQYEDEGGVWYCNAEPLYVRYVSNDTLYGLNIGAWRQPFAKMFEAYLAFETGLPVSGDKAGRDGLYSLFKERLKTAKALDAFDEAPEQKMPGRITQARFRRRVGTDGQ